jgi:hydroxyethylthiazole kinase-like uncharacterized protein yjeF
VVKHLALGSGETLDNITSSRQIEQAAQTQLPAQVLMQRAGLAVAKLALALQPHARHIWIACGSGNNGGDGWVAATHLQHWGKQVFVTWLGSAEKSPKDSVMAYQAAVAAGLSVSPQVPEQYDLAIDALLGIGATGRQPSTELAACIHHLNHSGAPVLAVDVPSGLCADTGRWLHTPVKASHTLSLLTLKPGLFTAEGRDASGDVWWDDLGVDCAALRQGAPTARLNHRPKDIPRLHASHKGSYGDLAVIGGASGMTGAAILAARAALHAGSGRVYLALLDTTSLSVDLLQPELMFRSVDSLTLSAMSVVCGCGGGPSLGRYLASIVATAHSLVLDADALNTLATDADLQRAVRDRTKGGLTTILTPHPLEAARLLQVNTRQVQQNRLGSAAQLAQQFDCVVILKGSGTVIAAPGQTSVINLTGNARLATAGTGDVLAGMVGAKIAMCTDPFDAACEAVFEHGYGAHVSPRTRNLTASELTHQMTRHP